MSESKIVILTDGEIAYLNGLLEAFDDLPDAAWSAACQDAIGMDPLFKDHNPYEVWIAWVNATADENDEDGEVRPEP